MDEQQSTLGGEWLAAQQKYWDAWLDLTRRALSGDGTEPAPTGTRDFLASIVQISQPYFELAEQIFGSTPENMPSAIEGWLDGLERALNAAPDGAAESYFKDHVQRLLSIPPMGYLRETQERQQQLTRLVFDYLGTLREYNAAFSRVGVHATERLRAKLRDAGSPPIDSLRKLYDVWVDACEEAYAEYAMSDEYSRRYGRLVNALTALRRHTTLMSDKTLESLNLPTRREMDTAHRHIRESRRENQRLRAQIEQLTRRLEQPGVPPVPALKRTPRKTRRPGVSSRKR